MFEMEEVDVVSNAPLNYYYLNMQIWALILLILITNKT